MSNSRITPFVKRMRVNGGTIFSFSSAVEDIGLNINEKNNIVKISNFALLNIPSVDEPDDITQNKFNIRAINGAWEYEQDSASVKDGRVLISESFQNYALNLESWLLNQDDYNPTLLTTVSERVFWKWMKETGATRWVPDASNYWTEELDVDGSAGYNTVVKYVGQVSAGNVRQDSFGTYNETYILVPTSHGETRAYFKQVDDNNYHHGISFGDGSEKILGREDFLQPHPDGLSYNAYYDFVDSSTLTGAYTLKFDASTGVQADGWWWSAYNIDPGASYTDNAYLVDPSIYISTGIYHTDLFYTGGTNNFSFRRSNVDCMSLEFDLDNLKTLYSDPTLTYDKIATEFNTNDTFEFNTALIYYTVYNSTGDVAIATNLLGVMFLDAPSGNSSNIGVDGILIPSLEKIMSTGTGFGTSYSLRLNIKTDNMIDDTGALVVDFATSDQLYAEDFTGIFYQLQKSVNILAQNNSTINYISRQYVNISSAQSNQQNQITSLKNQLNELNSNIVGPVNNIPMFAGIDSDDPLIESSIYMANGNIGIGETNPLWKLHVDGSTKVKDIVIENAIRDTSNNILLGYGSPLQLGSSTNYRDISFYTGGGNPAVYIDGSQNTSFANDVSIVGSIFIDGSIYMDGSILNVGGSVDSSSLWQESGSDIYYDAGNVGIGVINPLYALDVSAGSTNIVAKFESSNTSAQVYLLDGSTGNGEALRRTGDTLSLYANGVMGIDISPTALNLRYAGDTKLSTKTSGIDIIGDLSTNGVLYLNGISQVQTIHQLYYDSSTGEITFDVSTGGGGASSLWSSGANNEIYYNDGSVGIGLSSPSARFEVAGQIASYNGNEGTPGYGFTGDLSTGLYLITTGEMGIVAAGELVIKSTVNSAEYSKPIRTDQGAAGTPTYSFINDTDTGFYQSVTTGEIRVSLDGTERFRFAAGGNLHADADVIAYSTTVSDRRLKTKIANLGNKSSLNKILDLSPVEFEYKRKPGDKHFGFIAQDVNEILPEIVTENILIQEGDEKYLTLHQEELIPHIAAGMKEQHNRIGILEKENLELKAKINEILAKINI